MTYCPPTQGIFAGFTREQLIAARAQLQQAYIDLVAGNKGESYNYAQGDGGKGVTFTRANIAALTQIIAQLNQLLGVPGSRRRPIRPIYT